MDDVRVDLDALAELLSFFAKTAYKAAEHKDNPKVSLGSCECHGSSEEEE